MAALLVGRKEPGQWAPTSTKQVLQEPKQRQTKNSGHGTGPEPAPKRPGNDDNATDALFTPIIRLCAPGRAFFGRAVSSLLLPPSSDFFFSSEPVAVRVALFGTALCVKPVSYASNLVILIEAVYGRIPLNRLLRVGGIRHIPRRFDITMSCWIFNQVLFFFVVKHG